MSHLSIYKKSSRGFSTLEILIAMVVISLALSAAVLLTSQNQSIFVDTEGSNSALNVARRLLESEQALARKDFKLVNSTTTTETVDGTKYTEQIAVVPSVPDPFFSKKVTVSVSWPGTFGRSPSTALATLVTNFNNVVGGDTCYSTLADQNGARADWTRPQMTSAPLATLVGDPTGTYPITDIDAYQKKLYVTVSQTAQATAVLSPTAGSESGSGASWGTSVSNIKVSDNSRATATVSGTSVTRYLKASGFNFSIPPGATILGITVSIEKSFSGGTTGNVVDSEVRLVKNNVMSTSAAGNKFSGTSWPTTSSEAAVTYGSASDTWGDSWASSDFNSSFGVIISAKGSSSGTNRVANVDVMQVTISYAREFYVLDLAANPASPTYAVGLATTSSIIGLNAVAVGKSSVGTYAYVATNSTVNQLQVIDLNAAVPRIVATYALPGSPNAAGKSIFYSNGYIYLGLYATGNNVGREFHIIDVSNPTLPVERGFWPPAPPVAPYTSFNNDINSIYVQNGYAYLATPATPELIALNVLNVASPAPVGSYDAPDTVGNGRSLYQVGDTLYLGRTVTSANPELYLLNASDPSILSANNISPKTREIGSSVVGLIVRDILAFALTSKQGASPGQLQIWNVANPSSVSKYDVSTTKTMPDSGGSAANTGSGVALDCEGNYLYAASVDSASKGFISNMTGQ